MDLYLQIKGQIIRLYSNVTIPFPSNSWVMDYIQSRRYLYEVIQFFSEQFELIMSSVIIPKTAFWMISSTISITIT